MNRRSKTVTYKSHFLHYKCLILLSETKEAFTKEAMFCCCGCCGCYCYCCYCCFERVREGKEEQQRERGRECLKSPAIPEGSQILCGTLTHYLTTTCELMTLAKITSWILKQLSHPGPPTTKVLSESRRQTSNVQRTKKLGESGMVVLSRTMC